MYVIGAAMFSLLLINLLLSEHSQDDPISVVLQHHFVDDVFYFVGLVLGSGDFPFPFNTSTRTFVCLYAGVDVLTSAADLLRS